MIYIVRYWLPSGKLFKERFYTAWNATERFHDLLQAGHKNIKLYTQHSSDFEEGQEPLDRVK